jgi:hypothetical protein
LDTTELLTITVNVVDAINSFSITDNLMDLRPVWEGLEADKLTINTVIANLIWSPM